MLLCLRMNERMIVLRSLVKYTFVMFLNCLIVQAASKKVELAFRIVYTASCPLKSESTIIVDEKNFFKPAYRNTTIIRVKPGSHNVVVTHPWCSFYLVQVQVHQDGNFVAKVNNTKITRFPIVVRNMKPKEDPFNIVSHWSFIGLVGFLGFKFLFGSDFMKKKMQGFQEQLRQAQQQLQQQQLQNQR